MLGLGQKVYKFLRVGSIGGGDMAAKQKAVPTVRGRVDLVAVIRSIAFAQPGRVGIIGVADGHFRGLGVILFPIFGKNVDHLERTARGRDDTGVDDGSLTDQQSTSLKLMIELIQEALEHIFLEQALPKPANG